MEHYFKNKHKTFLGILLPVLGMIILTLIFYFLFMYLLVEVAGLNTTLGTIIAIILNILIIVFFIYRVIVNSPDYIVTDNEVIFRNSKKETLRVSFKDNVISSEVVRHTYNGIATATLRYMLVNDGKKEKKYICGLGKKNFDSFMSLIQAYSNKIRMGNIEGGINPQNIIGETREYFLNKRKVMPKIASKVGFYYIIITVLLAIAIFICVKNGDSLAFFYLFIPLLVVLYPIITFIIALPIKSKTPEKIQLKTNSLIIDENEFNYLDIAKVSLTPPSYYDGKDRRILKISTKEGANKKYRLGFKVAKYGKIDKVFPKYEEFAHLIEGVFINEPGKFQYDL